MIQQFDCAGRLLGLSSPAVMGILNVTPDSFSDGGDFIAQEAAVQQALKIAQSGASIIDVGGESTRPGAPDVSLEDELKRVVPVIEAIAASIDIPISVDTSKPEVMRAAVSAGAGMINDVYALRRDGAVEAVAELGVPVCLMHMQGEPRTMQQNPTYTDVVEEVKQFLSDRIEACVAAGISKQKIMVDPGFGFGKRLEHNLQLLKRLTELEELGVPILVGMSRKSMIGNVLNREVDQRLSGSLAVATLAAWMDASVIRVHDVAETVDAVRMVDAVRSVN